MQKSFNFFLCFYVIRHAICRFCLIWSYICNKVQKDTIRHEKMQKLKTSFPDALLHYCILAHAYVHMWGSL